MAFAEPEVRDAAPSDAPFVPPEWVPPVERPARVAPASPLAVAAVVVAFLALVASAGWLGWFWYARSVVAISAKGVQAFVRRDLAALAPLIPAQTADSPEFASALRRSSADTAVRFGETSFRGGTASAEVATPDGAARFTVSVAGDYLGEANVVWSGPPYGEATGRVVLVAEAQSWRILGIRLGEEATSFAPEDVGRVFGAAGGSQRGLE